MALLIKTTGIEDYLDPEGGGAWIKTLIIGGHGVGKTPFGAFWPKPIFAACEDGMMSVARLNVPYAEIHSNTDMDAFILRMRQECAKPLAKRQWFTVVVDTIDSYQRRLMQQRTRDMNLDRFTGWDNWDWLDAQFQKMINAFTNMPMHLVINLHHKEGMVGEGDDKSLVRTARLKGDSKESIFQDFDLIGFMETYYEAVGGERVRRRHIRWWPEPGFEFVRDRSNQLPQFTQVNFAESDFQTILDAITAGAQGITESVDVETLATETDVDATGVAAPDEGAGPVAEPKLPPAKKTAAKKAAAKTAAVTASNAATAPGVTPPVTATNTVNAAPEPEPEPEREIATPDAPVVEDPPEDKPVDGKGTADEPVILTEDQINSASSTAFAALQHVHTPEGLCMKNDFGDPCGSEPAPEPVKPKPAAQPAAAVINCGDQPPSLAGKFPAKDGCGTVLTPENRDKAQLAIVKFKTYLCNNCMAQHQAA